MANNNSDKRELSLREQQWVKTQRRFLQGTFEDVQSYIRDNAAIRHIEDAHQNVSDETMLNKVIVGYKHGDSRFSSEETMYDAISYAMDYNMDDIARFLFDPTKKQDKLLIEEKLDDMDEPIGTGFVAESSNKRTNVQFTQKIHPTTTTGIGLVIIRDPRSDQGFLIQTAFPAVHPDLLNPQDILTTDVGQDITPILEKTAAFNAKNISEVRKVGLRAACNDTTLPAAYIDYQEEHRSHPEQLFIMDKDTLDKATSPAVIVRQSRNGALMLQCTNATFESADKYSPSIKATPGKTVDQKTFAKQNTHLIVAAEHIFKQPFIAEPKRKGPARPTRPYGLTEVEEPQAQSEGLTHP